MRAKELRERETDELERMLNDARNELFQLRLKNATHQLDNTGKIPVTRKEIARINTVLDERVKADKAGSAEAKGSEE